MAEFFNKDLKIVFWISRSINKRKEELYSVLEDLDIFVCVESWLTEANHFHFPGFKTFRKDRNHSSGGGILMLIRNNLAFLEIDNLTCSEQSVELAGIKITNIKPCIELLVCYRAPGIILCQNT